MFQEINMLKKNLNSYLKFHSMDILLIKMNISAINKEHINPILARFTLFLKFHEIARLERIISIIAKKSNNGNDCLYPACFRHLCMFIRLQK